MRIARTLLLAATAAITALALTVATATADHLGAGGGGEQPGATLTVTDEAVNCPSVSTDGQTPPHSITGGCEISAHGGHIELEGHAFGFESIASICEVDFDGHVDANGEGWVDNAIYTGAAEAPAEDCTRESCEVEPGVMEPWPVHADEDATNGAYMQVEFCVTQDHSTLERCLVHVPIHETSPHVYSSEGFHTSRSAFPEAVEHDNASNCEIEVPANHPITIDTTTPVELVHP